MNKFFSMQKQILIGSFLLAFNISLFSQINPYVTGICFNDLNANGQMDAFEPPLQNVFVQPGHCHDPLVTCINGYYYAHLCTADDSLVVLKPDWLKYFTVNPPFHYVWQDSGYVNFAFILDTSAHDLKVTGITPCPMPRPGKDASVHAGYRNLADTISNPVLTVTLDNSLTFLSASPVPTLIQGDTLMWELPALDPLETGQVHIYFHTPATIPSGTQLHFEAAISPLSGDDVPANNSAALNVEVTDSVISLVKEVSHEGIIDILDIPSSPVLVYTVRFQNTDTVEIVNIRVTDTISPLMQRYNFELVSSSHPCTFQIEANGMIGFSFSDIFLPDSATNEPASHGCVSYSYRIRNDLEVHDTIKNTALVFYDFNEAIVTNTTLSIIDDVTGVHPLHDIQALIYPNPAGNNLFINSGSEMFSHYRIINITGTTLQEGRISQSENAVVISSLKSGIYLIQFSGKGKFSRAVFLKE